MAFNRRCFGSCALLFLAVVLAPDLRLGDGQAKAYQSTPGTDQSGDPLPKGAVARMGTVRFRTSSDKNFRLSRDGKTLVLHQYTRDPGLEICDAESGQLLHVVKRINPKSVPHIQALGFSPDSRILAVGRDGLVQLIQARTGQLLRKLEGEGLRCVSGIFTDDGLKFGARAENGDAMIWDAEIGRLLRTVPLNSSQFLASPALAPGLKFAVCTRDEHVVEIWDLTSGLLHKKLPRSESTIDWFVFTPNGSTLLFTDRAKNSALLQGGYRPRVEY